MGVNSLWDIVGPSARPVRLEALSRKKLAVDASIWIYQFMKAVRDQDGNSMPHAHIVGFFRRICKLLYFGIYPIFVFDGGAPALKRQTINSRRERRQGKKESSEQTARKLLAVQVHRYADRMKPVKQKVNQEKNLDDDTVYLEDLPNLHPLHGQNNEETTEAPIEKSKRFIKKDEYHLPELKEFKVSSSDSRIIPDDEYDEVSKESFDSVNGVDINKVDPNSKEFLELPLETQYMALSHLRLRSRLRMGYSKDQLVNLFPDSMDFSKFQIQQVQKRNFYTQKLMNVSGMGEDGNATRRIASDKDRKYALVRNADGWTLALDEHGTSIDKPVALDVVQDDVNDNEINNKAKDNTTFVEAENNINKNSNSNKNSMSEDDDDDIDWEDVPLEVDSDKETEEERNVQKALIESLYDMYEDNGTDDLGSRDLKQAIENSRKDLIDLRIKEEKIMKDRILTWRDELKLDDESKLNNQKNSKSDVEPSELPSFSFGQSMLFQNEPPKENNNNDDNSKKNQEKQSLIDMVEESGKVPINSTRSADLKKNQEKKLLIDMVEQSGKIPINSTKSADLEKNSSIMLNTRRQEKEIPQNAEMNKGNVSSNEFTDEKKQIEHNEITAKDQRSIPLWFNDEVSQIGNANNEIFAPQIVNRKRKYQDDEDAGLIPWNEARDIIDNTFDEVNSDSSIEEVQKNDLNQEKNEKALNEKRFLDTSINAETEDEAEKIVIREAPLDYDFEEKDEEELVEQMKEEENEHESFKSHIREKREIPSTPVHTSVTDEQLLQEQLQKAKRDSEEVTETMIRDVQELLKRFGIPYITAPMEAEAQCAELLKLNLIDGIITDDSDCFLFGGDRVYKNMFNQKQYVECYMMSDISSKIGLSQDKLIELALLLGSDYTEGVKGIGPVMAMEILAEFGTLQNFKVWFEENTKTTIPPDRSGLTSIKRSLLNKIKNGTFFLPESFPDDVIVAAYKSPEVDHDKSEFKWGVPSLDQIRSFLMYNVSWSQAKVDEVLIPLIRDMNRKKAEGTQSTISEFFPQEYIQSRKEIALGKRMKTAARKLNKNVL